jgi:hypothetical protein
MVAFVRGPLIGTVANTTTTSFNIGGLHRRSYVERISLSARTIIASTSAVSAVVSKYSAATNTAVALTAAFDLKSLVTEETSILPLLTTLSDAQRSVSEGDTFRIVVTAAGTITTQATDLICAVEVAVQE